MSKKGLFSFVAVCMAFLFVAFDALAAGSISFTRREVQESNGSWRLQMTIAYGGKPHLGHVPMRFSFTPTAIYERYLDDAHGDKPQTRKVVLSAQQPIVQIIDVGFSDATGKVYDRTRFEFVLTRAHNFEAGEYLVTVHRPDGVQIGSKQTIILKGDNPVVDRRTISFVDNPIKKVEEPKPAEEPAPAKEAEPEPEVEEEVEEEVTETEEGLGDVDAAKVPPSARGCGCRTAGVPGGAQAGLAFLGAAAFLASRRCKG